MAKRKKRPQTLKQRIRSQLWKFLMEEPPGLEINHREFAKLVRKAE